MLGNDGWHEPPRYREPEPISWAGIVAGARLYAIVLLAALTIAVMVTK